MTESEDLRIDRGPFSLTQHLGVDATKVRDLGVGVGYTRGNVTGGVQYDWKPGTNEQSIKASISFRF